ncbi:transposase zinc-binding domain-containing protein [Brevibacillus ruminantium]|uniref:Transposase zinc-binding domain-containing protein n=1 Tax=Brevibacillus ruminantium TaxID=2950604 RepID=A0ABY4WGE3_9BACL|nr:transposase zinc-binding domain-containing protein [Brevibacillus ruminantium]USG65934.1 transposase zinc-binding domain-containing protein [Brevibacillus ruminantium]
METNVLKQIFIDHWKPFVKKYGKRIRPSVLKEVQKFLNCGDPKNGFKLFVCEGCHHTSTTCSCSEAEEWSRIMNEEVLQVNHRHVTFTIDEGLRVIFQKYRRMLKEFMNEAVRLVQEWFEKKLKVAPGIIAGLYTFGSHLNFDPHVSYNGGE